MKRWFKGLSAILVLVMLLTTSGCGSAPTDPAAEMLSYLTNREYARIYKLLDPDSLNGMTLAEMTDRYESVYSTLSITSLSARILENVQTDANTRRVTVLMTYQSDKLGELNMGNEITMVYKGGQWLLTWSPSLLLPGMEEGDSLRLNNIAAQRGEIFDVNGELLAQNDYAITVYAQSDEIKDPDTLARLAAPLLSMTETDILKRIDPDRFVEEEEPETTTADTEKGTSVDEENVEVSRSIALNVFPKDDLDEALEEQILEIEGLHVDRSSMTPIRYYPYGSVLSHTLGYTGVITAEDKENEKYANLADGTLIGRSGLEAAYDDVLRGVSGYELAIYDKSGAKKQILASVPAVDGSDLRLTVDLSMEQTVETLLLQHLTSDMSGSVIVMDPKTGAIDAIASYPTFDPNIFSYTVSQAVWDYFTDEANRTPLYNRSTLGLYPPGSTLKPFVGAIGLMTGAITLDFAMDQSRIEDNEWKPDDERWVYPPIRRVSATPDPLNLYHAIVNSDNIFFAYTALAIGADAFRDALKNLGFEDEDFPFDLPVSTSRISNDDEFSSQKLLADSGYGQGELLISPLQMASIFSALANGGDVYRPYIVSSIKRTEGIKYVTESQTEPTLYRSQIISSETVETLQDMLRGVVTSGTGSAIDIAGMSVHAKTGTAQVGSDNSREIAWLIGYNTEGENQRLVCVMVEVPANEGGVRNAIARGIFQAIKSGPNLVQAQNTPTPSPSPEPTATPEPQD